MSTGPPAARPTSRTDRPRTYEGRTLPRPDDELVDQGLAFDLATMVSRRRVLSLLGVGAGAATLAACGSSSSNAAGSTTTSATGATTTTAAGGAYTEIPDETSGPFPGDGTNGPDVLEEAGVIRSDIRPSFGDASGVADGVPLTLTFTLIDMANDNAPYAGAAFYLWQCDAEGRYSMYSPGVESENFLRGAQIADRNGDVTFTTIVPGCYPGRWPHMHFEVYPDEGSITDHDTVVCTSQAALPGEIGDEVYDSVDLYSASIASFGSISIADDNVFDTDSIDLQMLDVSGSVEEGYTARLYVPIDTSTEPTSGGGGAPGGGR